MGKKIRVWDGTAWQDVAPSLPYTAIHSAQASMPLTGVDGQVWLDTDGTLAGQDFVPLAGGTMTGNLNTPSINSGPIVGRNNLLNGDFSIWQRGTSFTGTSNSNVFTADRWIVQSQGVNSSVSKQVLSGGEIAGYDSESYIRISNASAGSANTLFIQRIEDVRSMAGQNVTVSFWAKASTATTIYVRSDQDFGSGGSSRVANGGSGVSVSTTWQRRSATFALSSISGKTIGPSSYLDFFIYWANTSAQTVDLWGIQIELGSQATPFHTATPNQQTELAACQRYYYRTSGTTYTPLTVGGYTQSTTDLAWWVPLPVSMRVAPTSLDFSGSGAIAFRSANNGSGYTMGNLTFASSLSTPTLARGGGSISSGTWVAFHSGYLEGNNGPCFLGFSAEL
jgi:hypothetical protein